MGFISEDQRGDVRDVLAEMDDPVTVRVFTDDDCQYCDETVELNEELAEIGDDITLERYDVADGEAAAAGVDEYGGPATVITRTGSGDEGVRYFGIPSGQEFGTYLQDIVAVSTGTTGLDADVAEAVADLDGPVDIKVFVTPTCPHCPGAVRVAHDFAILNDDVEASMIESQEFMELSREYGVRGVPHVVVNDEVEFKGAQPPEAFLEQVQQAL
ncbi:MAG: thioredoxin family protein [Haloarculaceae archaeon]